MSEQLKLEQLKARMEVAKIMTSSTYGSPSVSADWVMKNILGISNKGEIRKIKIDRIYGR